MTTFLTFLTEDAPFTPTQSTMGASSVSPKKAGSPNTAGGAHDALAQQMFQAEQEKEKAEQLARQQRDAEETIEREKLKRLRLKAEDDVAQALDSRYNDKPDQVEFYPSALPPVPSTLTPTTPRAPAKPKSSVTEHTHIPSFTEFRFE